MAEDKNEIIEQPSNIIEGEVNTQFSQVKENLLHHRRNQRTRPVSRRTRPR